MLFRSVKLTGFVNSTEELVVDVKWPEADEDLLEEDIINIAIQVNGKLRSEIKVDSNSKEEDIKDMALNEEKILKHIQNQKVRKVIYVSGRLVNIVL